MPRIITLTTDFGLQDYFVGAMKGVMLSTNPDLNFVDITHLVPPQDIRSASFTLGQTYSYFPADTIHLAVVDPGVGSARKAVVVYAGAQFFVAPDNGILTHVLSRETDALVHEITAEHYFRKPVSSTFHGRDIFAPAAAWLSKEIALEKFGPPLLKPVRFPLPAPTRLKDNLIEAAIQAVDRFGNLVTNLRPEDVPAYHPKESRSCKILAAKREITSFRRTFSEGKEGEIFVVPGSTGFLEIVAHNGSATSLLEMSPGAVIGVVLG